MRILSCLLAIFLVSNTAFARAPLRVVATFSILGDIAQHLGGDQVQVETLVGPGQDAHRFEPRVSDIRKLAAAQVIVANGLNFEPWMTKAISAAEARGLVVSASQGITPLEGADPHAWHNAALVKRYVANIAQAYVAADPDNRLFYRAQAAFYSAELDRLDAEIKTTLGAIPEARRVAVTNHDAFGYFGAAYGVRFLAPIGVSTETEPSAATVARLIAQIRQEKITAVFVETLADPRLIAQIARETGAKVGPAIYSDTLSATDGPAPSYVKMMRYNLAAFVAAMR